MQREEIEKIIDEALETASAAAVAERLNKSKDGNAASILQRMCTPEEQRVRETIRDMVSFQLSGDLEYEIEKMFKAVVGDAIAQRFAKDRKAFEKEIRALVTDEAYQTALRRQFIFVEREVAQVVYAITTEFVVQTVAEHHVNQVVKLLRERKIGVTQEKRRELRYKLISRLHGEHRKVKDVP